MNIHRLLDQAISPFRQIKQSDVLLDVLATGRTSLHVPSDTSEGGYRAIVHVQLYDLVAQTTISS